MKYLKKFATQAEYDAYVSGGMETPNVSLVEETYTTFFTKKVVEEPEVIEYHFEIPMESHGLLLGGEIYGDFSDTHSKLLSFIRSNGANDEFGLLAVDSEILNQKTNITVNDEKVISMRYDDSANFIDMGTSAPESTLQVHLTMVTYEKSLL